jgi:hypothetical protein
MCFPLLLHQTLAATAIFVHVISFLSSNSECILKHELLWPFTCLSSNFLCYFLCAPESRKNIKKLKKEGKRGTTSAGAHREGHSELCWRVLSCAMFVAFLINIFVLRLVITTLVLGTLSTSNKNKNLGL